jgi:hypothetical protein
MPTFTELMIAISGAPCETTSNSFFSFCISAALRRRRRARLRNSQEALQCCSLRPYRPAAG